MLKCQRRPWQSSFLRPASRRMGGWGIGSLRMSSNSYQPSVITIFWTRDLQQVSATKPTSYQWKHGSRKTWKMQRQRPTTRSVASSSD